MSPKKFLIFREMELSCSNLKKFLIFSQKKKRKLFLYFGKCNFLIFQKTKTPKKFIIFQKTEIPKRILLFQEMELSYILGRNFSSLKNKKAPLWKFFLYFRKWNFVAPSLENFLFFRRELAKPENQNFPFFFFFLIPFLKKKQNFLN